MTGNYAYTPIIWPSVISTLLLIALAVYSWRHRRVPAALPFLIGCLFAAAWASGSAMEIAAMDMGTKILWAKFQAACQMPVATAITCFLLEYAWPGRWLTRRSLVLLSLPCLLALGLVITNDFHHLAWRGFEFNGSVIPLLGPASWVLMAYGYMLGIVNILVFAWLFLRSPQQRWPVVVMLAGLVGGRLTYLLEKTYILHADLPLDMLGMAFEFLMYAIALFGFRLFDPIPLARQMAIEQLHAGVLVLDPHGRIISLNPASAAILGLPRRHLHGRLLREILPLYSDPEDGEVGESEISLPEINPPGKTSGTAQGEVRTGMKARYYQLETSALKDWRGLEVGRLLLVHDVTEQKRAQAQLLEQQRALVMLQEREQLARDLHDSIGQTLAYAGFQVEAASKLFQDGQAVSAIAQLKRLAGVLHEAHAEVREYILDLRSAHSPQQPFFSVLRHYLEGFTNNYGIQVLFSADERLGDEPFSPEARMQVIRILQEALSNARRHGHSRCVRVTFVMEDSLVRMIVQDDGIGFDPSQPAGEDHLGLHLMRERTEGMGGVLRIESAAGEGTSVILEIPGGVKEYA